MPKLFLAALFAFPLAGCGPTPAPVPPPSGAAPPAVVDDATKIQGVWTGVSRRIMEGTPDEPFPNFVLELRNGEFTITLPDNSETGNYMLVPGSAPKQIDLVNRKNEALRGYYSLEGDKLTLCLPDEPGSARPAEFKASGEAAVVVLIRRK